MAVALDLRDDPVEYVVASRNDCQCSLRSSIHPRTKLDVGYRLSRSGLAVAYGQQVEFQGPIVASVAYSTGSRTVNLTYTSVQNIELRNPNGFEVCPLPYSLRSIPQEHLHLGMLSSREMHRRHSMVTGNGVLKNGTGGCTDSTQCLCWAAAVRPALSLA